MKVQIKSLLEGAKSAKGIAVIIDVINASSTIVECLQKGAREVVPVGSVEEALDLKKKGYIFCGEMKSFSQKADVYNSPHAVSKIRLKGKKIVVKTDAGTKGILGAKKADEVILGCFLNASAVVKYLKKKKPKVVTLVPMGDYGKSKNVEDEAFAFYLKNLLEGKKPVSFKSLRKHIKRGSLRNFFRSIFMRKHLHSSLRVDTSEIVPKLVKGKVVAQR